MKPPDILGLVIRIAGFFLITFSLWYLLTAVRSIPAVLFSHDTSSVVYFLLGTPMFIYGVVCLFCADWIVRLSYKIPPA